MLKAAIPPGWADLVRLVEAGRPELRRVAAAIAEFS
jgi:hypothetical protein